MLCSFLTFLASIGLANLRHHGRKLPMGFLLQRCMPIFVSSKMGLLFLTKIALVRLTWQQ